ncbi:putative quinol monooxygenase [Paraglaciecola marina]|uniref:putative quinol monooxygenase n=1 Tax=Paraglaciecola marina TaxID=2500157 RepID=UPI00105E0D73|nr:putative quinol monooxygenase [Paraglaciecola marina]
MIDIVAFIQPKPEKFAHCRRLITEILAPTLLEEGCKRFELFTENNNTLVLVETFESQEALDFHYNQDYVKSVFTEYEFALEKEPEIHKLLRVNDDSKH